MLMFADQAEVFELGADAATWRSKEANFTDPSESQCPVNFINS